MRYTIRAGVEHPYSALVKENFRYLLPLLVILAGILFFVLSPSANKAGQKPYTLGIYTVKTHHPSSNNGGGSDTSPSSGGGSAGSPSVLTLSGVSSAGSNSTPSVVQAAVAHTASSVTGGMGGGDASITTTPSPPTTSIVTCDNTGGILPMTCVACTPALVVPVGQKVLLSSSGSCSLLN